MKKLFLSILLFPLILHAQTTTNQKHTFYNMDQLYQKYNIQATYVKTPFDDQILSMLTQDATIHLLSVKETDNITQILKDYTKLLKEQEELSNRFDKLKFDLLNASLVDNKNIDIDKYQFALSNDLTYLIIVPIVDTKINAKFLDDLDLNAYTSLKIQ